MLTSLNQKVRSRLPLSTLGAHGHDDCRGRVGVYPTASNDAEHGKPVSPPRKGQADRKGGRRGCGQEISEKANAGL